MRSGLPYTHRIELASGFPDANITWTLLDHQAQTVATGTITPPAQAVSVNLQISAAQNALPPGVLLGGREILWSYSVASVAVAGTFRYELEGPLPLMARPEGVRLRLGIDDYNDLPDEDIRLIDAYLGMERQIGAAALSAFLASADAYSKVALTASVEAAAALALLPSLQVRLAQKESSGTNQYTRGKIDWEKLEAHLSKTYLDGVLVAAPNLDPIDLNTSALIALVTPATDLFPDG